MRADTKMPFDEYLSRINMLKGEERRLFTMDGDDIVVRPSLSMMEGGLGDEVEDKVSVHMEQNAGDNGPEESMKHDEENIWSSANDELRPRRVWRNTRLGQERQRRQLKQCWHGC
ncbi:hypothetical protein K435DRAFT_202161 [Dendrothele bispora CBS 962.96]|uniref:Uncharacterized protein n=1 Tax=Dendrothele bispora (strain CBS 962.96) TaxID=1314807 RepID=A0A4S8MN27_DENBC|nr:hypothetical protein K435DRAFT_202161 [Dendrothele bispora CBS 962.96]